MNKLPKAPLKEVVFDILWEMKQAEGGFPYDPGFEFAQGIFAQKIKHFLPVRKRTVPENAPFTVYPQVIHQFWQDELTWPLVQYGPGILTVNEVEGSYDWKHYGQLIDSALIMLDDSYEQSLSLTQMQLRYVDAVELTKEQFQALDRFVAENLRINITNGFDLPGVLTSLQVQQGFRLDDGTLLNLSINDGRNTITQQLAVIWTTTVVKRGRFSLQEAKDWKNVAHQQASDIFRKMMSPSFYQTFL
ncbi:TIGR04255 family protein [Spirosoma spitsbergense]|uniref:TIGR04255 family protein n=1 Tax=Spirosoma spitsbergense TaxID=431554 RepID=UPI000367DF23|nr:TIGR04255 family protein [Spirosoma spitsbergense]